MRARCRSSGEDYNLVTQGVKETFDLNLLSTFCTLRLRMDVVDVTEERLIAEINTLLGKGKNDDLPDIKALFLKELQMDLKESDVNARRFAEVVLENDLEEVFSGANGEAEKCRRLISSLAPPVLKKTVKNVVRWTHKEAGKNIQELYTLVYEKAVEHERHFHQNKPMRMTVKDKPALPKSAKDAGKTDVSSKKPSNAKSEKKFSQQKIEREVEKKNNKKNDKQPVSRKEPPSPCPKCQEMHCLSDCDKATDAEKIVLWQKLREANKARKSRMKILKKLMPSTSRTVTINEILDLPCCPDTVHSLAYGSHLVVTTKKVLLHVLIHTAAGPVQPAEAVLCLIMGVDDDEFIIGRDLLSSLGIDVDRQLEQLASHADDETSGDPFELEADELPANPNHVASDEEVCAAVEVLIERALKHGFSVDKVDKLRVIVHMYDVWRLELRDDPPTRVPPLKVRLKEGAQPCKCKPRKYPPHVRQFLREFNTMLEGLGWIYDNPTSRWASPVLPVKMSQELMNMRQTTDYREFNLRTDIMGAVMSILSLVMENARGKQHFGLFDFIKGFWQLPLAEFCQEWLSYMTDEKIYTPRRVPQGCGDAAIYFQKTMEKCFATLLYKYLLVWIDDLLLYADDIDTYLDKLKELFSLLDKFDLKLSVKNQPQEVKWCGKIIDANGVRHDPTRIEALRAIPYPSSAGGLQQFLCAVNWMRESLINYARQVSPLRRKLDEALAKTRRTKRAAAGISIELSGDENATFDNVKKMLESAATLAFPDDSATTCLLTDASDVAWALIVTQVKGYNLKHQLVECLSWSFTGSQLNWTVIEKEVFPIALACDKLDYLLRPQGFRLFCDHRNLIHVFAPDEHVKKHVKGKLLRWALKLMNYNYVIEHIAGPQNVWADMISRWAGNRTTTAAMIKRVRSTPLVAQPEQQPEVVEHSISMLRLLDDSNFVWPTFAEIELVQSVTTHHKVLSVTKLVSSRSTTRFGFLWKRRTLSCDCLSLHTVLHKATVDSPLWWKTYVDCSRWRTCALWRLRLFASVDCVYIQKGGILSPGLGVKRLIAVNAMVCYISISFQWVMASENPNTADSSVTVEAFLDWHSRFRLPPNWISDQGSHFKNEVMGELSRRLRTQQDVTPAY
ncbi:LOW QUALITY PROTEIN: hypothetical protein PHMEG_0005519 [Phytophthora megakarya]|uniref:Reverse transcriptase domain-containing protein n=1 Tax=Phytophthora megakarya TaxID=4795 RepID=A0A225WT30_9STRA|nr:LOW QUALITY PROTEIN: hypothetical protein PHMEG_0005519 [Phytophthora megakarya]